MQHTHETPRPLVPHLPVPYPPPPKRIPAVSILAHGQIAATPPGAAPRSDAYDLPALNRLSRASYRDLLDLAGAIVPAALLYVLGAAVILLLAAR
ncbi:MAG: hypothetical protein ACJ79O_21350 [Myxococcales bacterium]